MRQALKLVILTFPFWIVFRSIILLRNKNSPGFSWSREILYSVTFMYSIALMSITLLDLRLGADYSGSERYALKHLLRRINLIPFKDTVEMFKIAIDMKDMFFMRWALLNVIGNGVLLLPLGFLLPILNSKYKNFKNVLNLALAVACSIEFLQFFGTYLNVFVRTVDIDDIILNTAGAVLGYLLVPGTLKNME